MKKSIFEATTLGRELTLLFIIFLMGIFAFGFWRAPCLPEKIPVHWNAQGQIDNYANKKFVLLFYPLLTLALYLLFLLLPATDPLKNNYKKFAFSYYLIKLLLIGFLAIFYFYILFSILNYLKIDTQLLITVLMALFFLAIGLILPKIKQNYFFGFTIPWTLHSEKVWDKTHYFAGKIFIFMALALSFLLFLRKTSLPIIIGIFLFGIFIPIIYSFFVYRKLTPAN